MSGKVSLPCSTADPMRKPASAPPSCTLPWGVVPPSCNLGNPSSCTLPWEHQTVPTRATHLNTEYHPPLCHLSPKLSLNLSQKTLRVLVPDIRSVSKQ